jgi:hypothetical protein
MVAMSNSVARNLSTQLLLLPFKCVRLTALDEQQREIDGATSSGFIRNEANGCYLYTCWHVVSELNPHDLRVMHPTRRRYLKISMQASEQLGPGVDSIGGFRTFTVPLYDTNQQPPKPVWFQDDAHIPQADLNAIGIYVPFYHDVVKIRLRPDFEAPETQIVTQRDVVPNWLMSFISEKVLLVGYPYGYSALGQSQPTPIALTRFIASTQIAGRRRELLLESPGAPGMSGGPVFKEIQGSMYLFGIYTGLIYPDAELQRREREKTTTLGTIVDISFLLVGDRHEMTQRPSNAVTSEGWPYKDD